MSQPPPIVTQSFSYSAQTLDGRPFAGTIEAVDTADAQRQLESLQLRVVQIDAASGVPRAKPLRGDDFIAFNQQLAMLTGAGMPVEQGLRLIAQDMRSGRLAATIRLVVAELESGRSLSEAFDRHRSQFPPLYARLVEAGIKSNNLSGILLNLGEHLSLTHRMKATLWRELSYPAMVLAGLVVVVSFLGMTAVTGLRTTLLEFKVHVPFTTQLILWVSGHLWEILSVGGVGVAAVVLFWQGAKFSWTGRLLRDQISLRIPLIGPILRRNLAARWCDAVRLGVVGGLDLPASIELATHAVRSPLAEQDGRQLVSLLESGRRLDDFRDAKVLPSTVPVAMALGADRHDLAGTLASLRDMFQRQAQTRLDALPAILTPLYVIILGVVFGIVISGLFMPLINMIRSSEIT
jgi:type IV pilus assembly protein PilC